MKLFIMDVMIKEIQIFNLLAKRFLATELNNRYEAGLRIKELQMKIRIKIEMQGITHQGSPKGQASRARTFTKKQTLIL